MLKYLRLTRAHTVPLEAIPALLGAALGVGTIWSMNVLLWGLFGILYHLTGYGHNSLSDWENGYDKNDKFKEHHPLNKGTISHKTADRFIKVLFIIIIIYGLILSYGSINAFAGLVLAFIFGVLYNTHGKVTELKFVYISLAHTMVFVVPYLAVGGTPYNLPFIAGIVYMFTWISFQISVSGEVKDIVQDESNFLRTLGTEVIDSIVEPEPMIEFSKRAKQYAYNLKVINIISGVVILGLFQSHYIWVIPITILSVVIVHQMVMLLLDGFWMRHERVKQMSAIEMLTSFIFILAFIPVIGVPEAILLLAASSLWVLIGNKVLWGTLIGPKV